jgi:hypothetical protein
LASLAVAEQEIVFCRRRNLTSCVPSLADLSRIVLGKVLREEETPHDCRADAWAALQLVQHLMQGEPSLVLDPPEVKVRDRLQFAG